MHAAYVAYITYSGAYASYGQCDAAYAAYGGTVVRWYGGAYGAYAACGVRMLRLVRTVVCMLRMPCVVRW